MAEHLYTSIPNVNLAYHNDGTTGEYFGDAPRGVATTDAKWRIFKIEYANAWNTAGDPWIIKWAVDAKGNGSDAPIHVWDNVASLTYKLLASR